MKFLLFLLVLTLNLQAFGQTKLELKSPDGKIVYTFKLTKDAPLYQVQYKGQVFIDYSSLGLSFETSGDFARNLKMGIPVYASVNETYDLVVGKTKTAIDNHRQVRIPLFETSAKGRNINLVVRVFNDGVAFRYEFPEQKEWKSYVLLEEKSTFNISRNPKVHTLFWDNYSNSHEGLYVTVPYEKVAGDKMMDLPALFEYPDHVYMAITEASLRDYAGMYLKNKNVI